MSANFHKQIVLALLAIMLFSTACNKTVRKLSKPGDGFLVGFYNLENLFDSINDPTINDEEFLPDSRLGWNTKKYDHKLDQMARVVAAMDSGDYPHFLGFAEVENAQALFELATHAKLHGAAYATIHVADNDPRGIEVAAIYRPEYMRVLKINTLQTSVGGEPQRHILYVKGLTGWGDTLHLFVNHWTSRYGGLDATKAARNGTASFLKSQTDSLLAVQPEANILIMGDFNDNPEDESMMEHLQALPVQKPIEATKLYNLALEPHRRNEGTLFYKSWDCFDQVIVSGSLLDKGRLRSSEMHIVKHPWMMFKNQQGVERPNRTQSNGKYFGGFSDHLPVFIRLTRNK